ncbi:MAG: DUF11 domain-containing protein [Anaerolineae bacterium]|nr:DUF11 domain-containing protein [Anaerolineae bacterium]
MSKRSLSLSLIFILLISTLAIFSHPALALAQTPPSLEMSVLPQAKYAVAGQAFTYTVVMTNTGPGPAQEVMVFVTPPPGVTQIQAGQHPAWFTSAPASNETGKVAWATLSPMAAGTAVRFEMVVVVLPEMAGQHLVLEDYGIVPMHAGGLLASGPPLKTEVRAAPPTLTATPLPTAITANPPNPTATTLPTPTSPPISLAPTSPAVPTTGASALPSATSTNPTGDSTTLIWPLSGLSLLLLIIVGLAWFWKSR